jgi:hypothetical protein
VLKEEQWRCKYESVVASMNKQAASLEELQKHLKASREAEAESELRMEWLIEKQKEVVCVACYERMK